jgi:serine/threonine protein kinase
MAESAPEASVETASTMAALGQSRVAIPGTIGVKLPDGDVSQRFFTTSLLGAGGMGVVSCVWDGDLARELALKRIRPELRENQQAVSMFLWEARVTAYLDHPNIVPIHDLGHTSSGEPYFTMKRVAGTPLQRVLEGLRANEPDITVRWTLKRRLRALHQVCLAVAFAHRRGVLHRDLKPANVMLGEDGEVVVMDWGLAVALPGNGDRLRAAMPVDLELSTAGTPLYMSPEQARGEMLDERSDVYALGIIAYELATLARPYEASNAAEMMLRISAGATRPAKDVMPAMPPALAAILDCALRPSRRDRYPSVAALASDLEEFLDGGTPAAEHASSATQLARFYMKRDRRIANLRVFDIDMIAASATALGIAIGVWFAPEIGALWWVLLIVAAIAAVPPIRAWFGAPGASP